MEIFTKNFLKEEISLDLVKSYLYDSIVVKQAKKKWKKIQYTK